MPKPTIFLTGTTGLVGSYFLKIFLENGHRVYALARPREGRSAQERVKDALKFWDCPDDTGVIIIEGDVNNFDLGAASGEVEEIYHSAAVTDLNWPLEKIRKVNVGGCRNIFELALKCPRLAKINQISTAYVYGDYTGRFTEVDLDLGQKFSTTYEQTKFEAEKLAHDYRMKGLWIDIYRPSIIIGHSQTGKTPQLKNIYQILNLCKLELFDTLPLKGCRASLVPVDLTCEAMYLLASSAKEKNKAYHPFPPKLVPIEEVIKAGSRVMSFKMPKITAAEDFNLNKLSPAHRILLQNTVLSVNFITGLDSSLTNRALEKLGFKMPEVNEAMLERIIRYFT